MAEANSLAAAAADLRRPDRVQLIFDRVVAQNTPGEFRTRVTQDGVHPSLHIGYKNFDLKRHFKRRLPEPQNVATFLKIFIRIDG